MNSATNEGSSRTFKALQITPPPIWNGFVIISADCCVNGVLIKAGTVMRVWPLPIQGDGGAE